MGSSASVREVAASLDGNQRRGGAHWSKSNVS